MPHGQKTTFAPQSAGENACGRSRRMSHTDVLGSWTGVPWEDADEEPVQDADDL